MTGLLTADLQANSLMTLCVPNRLSQYITILAAHASLRARNLLLLVAMSLAACDANFEPLTGQVNTAKQLQSSPKQTSRLGRQAVFSYPEFSGPYSVGSQLIELTDWSRMDPFDPENLNYRQLQVRFFYPKKFTSSPDKIHKLPVIDQNSWNYLIGHQTIDGKKLSYANYHNARWNIELDAKVHPQTLPFPVLIFSHGYGYNHNSYSALLGELASQGYIIAAINHSFGANPAYLPSGETIWAKPLPAVKPSRFIPLWSDDQRFVIDQLIQLNQTSESLFYQKLDIGNIGLFGHSYGGAAAYYTAYQDARVKAIMDIDGSLFEASARVLEQPLAFLLSKYHQPTINLKDSTSPIYLLRLLKFKHQSFSDHILWWQWDFDDDSLGYQQLDALRAVELSSQLVDAFFAAYLKNKPSFWNSMLALKSNHLEIRVINKPID